MAGFSTKVSGPAGPDFGGQARRLLDGRRLTLTRAALLVHRDARRNAPVSPTQQDLDKVRTGKRRPGARKPTAISRPKPGGLTRSIAFRVGEDNAEVFVSANSEAGKYAQRIHDEKGKTWFNRGPGTVAKGPQADELFILRARDSNQATIRDMIRKEVERTVKP